MVLILLMTRKTNTRKVCAQNATKDLWHANVPAILQRVTQKQQVTTRQPTLKKQSVYGPGSTQRYLPLSALHVATLTRNGKGGRPKKLKVGAPERSTSGSRRDSVADTELDGCGSVTELDFGSVANKELDCGSVADKELDCGSVADKETSVVRQT